MTTLKRYSFVFQSPRHSDSDSSDSHSDLEAPPTLTPPVGLLNNNHHRTNMTTLESVTSMAALASAVAALSGNPQGGGGTPTNPLHFYPPSLLQSNWYLANIARNFHQQQPERMDVEKAVGAGGGSGGGGEQPLDLSAKPANSSGGSSDDSSKMVAAMRLPTLDTKHIFK